MKKALLLSLAVACLSGDALAQRWTPFWAPDPTEAQANPVLRWVRGYQALRVEEGDLEQVLRKAPKEVPGLDDQPGVILRLPTTDGRVARYRVWENSLLGPQVQNQIPWFRTFSGQGIDEPSSVIRAEFGRGRFTAMILGEDGTTYFEPLLNDSNTVYFMYRDTDSIGRPDWRCDAHQLNPLQQLVEPPEADGGTRSSGNQLYMYRLAINTTVEYTAARGGVSGAPASVATTVNRVDGIYRRDLAVGFNLVWLKNWEVEPDGFTNSSNSSALGQNPTVLNNTATGPGVNAYDLGHVFTTTGGGVAYLASVGGANKAGAASGLSNPTGDAFDLIVAHEIGHQFDGYHAFNATGGNCASNRMWQGAYEPGAGASIMSYAGRCTGEITESDLRAYFNAGTISRMLAFRNTTGGFATVTGVTNNLPVATVGPNRTIPRATPFKLAATGFDADGDSMTFVWEQVNLPASSSTVHAGPTTSTTTNTSRPLFRSFIPSASGNTRFIPSQSLVLANDYTNQHEFLPNVDRSIRMRATVRDNRAIAGGVSESDVVLTVSGSPFQVTSFGSAGVLNTNQTHLVTWDVGGGSVANTVNIILSTNGGASYFTGTGTTLLSGVPNNGSATVTLPATTSSNARIFVEAADNIFYDVNNAAMTISTSNRAPVVQNPGTQNIPEEAAWTLSPTFEHLDNLQTLTWSLQGPVPAGVSINSSTGQITWTPTESQGAGAFALSVRATDNGSPNLSSTQNFTVNVSEVQKLVTGTVSLPSFLPGTIGQIITAEFVPIGGSVVAETRQATLNGAGAFSIDATVAPGQYNVLIRRDHFLRKAVGSVTVSSTGGSIGAVTLINGDVDNNGEVDAADIDLIIQAFGNAGGSGDIDGSGEVDAADIDIALSNFGSIGD